MAAKEYTLGLFQAVGVELEYMIVHDDTLDVNPVADKVLYKLAGSYTSEVEMGSIAVSNELVQHVIELKTNGPAAALVNLAKEFQKTVNEINTILLDFNSRLMPTAMHPWMNPFTDTVLWQHEYNEIYEAYNRIFSCKGHGWSNLQSTHINLPFKNDKEFEKLHAAIRILLPIMPALAASSPVFDERANGVMDNRMIVYSRNADMLPFIAGKIVPEPVFSEKDYQEQILERMYQDIAPFDPENILNHEWLNSRGAIARFERGSIEIRVLDIQECPLADISVVWFILQTLKVIISEKWSHIDYIKNFDTDELSEIFFSCSNHGEKSNITNGDYLKIFGITMQSISTKELLQHIFREILSDKDRMIYQDEINTLNLILEKGSLSARIMNSLANDISRKRLLSVYSTLCQCLEQGRVFH